MLAILQSALHLYYNYDSVTLPVTQFETDASSGQPPKREHPIIQIKALLVNLPKWIGIRAVIMTFLGPIFYLIFIRMAAWCFFSYMAALLQDVPASQRSYIPPYNYSLVVRSFTSSVCLSTLWDLSNAIFSAYLTQEPMKQDQPLTSSSKDPNASLLNGLKAKREILRVSSIAFYQVCKCLTCLDICVLRAGSHQSAVPSTAKSHLRRHRSPERFGMGPDHDSLLGKNSRHQQSRR